MKITEVKIEFIKPSNGLVAFTSLVVNDSIYLSSIAIYKKLNGSGYRILYPKKGVFEVWHPITTEASRQIEEVIFNKLKEVINKKCNDYDRYSNYENSI